MDQWKREVPERAGPGCWTFRMFGSGKILELRGEKRTRENNETLIREISHRQRTTSSKGKFEERQGRRKGINLARSKKKKFPNQRTGTKGKTPISRATNSKKGKKAV